MTIEYKTFLMSILGMPCLALSPSQIEEIERVIDGKLPEVKCVAVTYRQAADMLGFTSKWSDKTMMKFVNEGLLDSAGRGRVTLESVRDYPARRQNRARRV